MVDTQTLFDTLTNAGNDSHGANWQLAKDDERSFIVNFSNETGDALKGEVFTLDDEEKELLARACRLLLSVNSELAEMSETHRAREERDGMVVASVLCTLRIDY